MTVKQRLIEFAKTKEKSVRAFEISTGLTIGYINAIRVSVQPDKIQRIASRYPDLNVNWLLTGEGEMLNTSDHPPIEIEPVSGGEINVSQLMNMMQKQMDMVNSVMEQNRQLVETNAKLMQELMKLGKEERPAIEDFGSVEDRQ